jgi:hypothetical protein
MDHLDRIAAETFPGYLGPQAGDLPPYRSDFTVAPVLIVNAPDP